MNTEFLEQILANAEKKKEAELNVKAEIKKQSSEVLLNFAKPILDFIFFVNEKYVFNTKTEYDHDKVFVQFSTKREQVEQGIKNNSYAKIPIIRIDGTRNYISFSIKEFESFVSVSDNDIHVRKTFTSVEEFINYLAEQVVKNGELKK